MKAFVGFFILSALFLVSFLLYPSVLANLNSNISGNIESPLPDFLTKNFTQVMGANTLWKPSVKVIDSKVTKPKITAVSALSYDLTENKLVYEKDIKRRLPLASLTKIMTSVIALENMPIDQELEVSKKASEIGENSMGLPAGETLVLKDLLYGLILLSGNDAAETIAENSPMGRDNFVYLMNKEAEDMGLSDTRFTNPSGLEGDGLQYSSSYDLLVMTRYALQNPVFADIAQTVKYEIPQTQDHSAYYLFNETNLLTSYPGVKGVKTGYTYEAGLCLVTYLEHNNRKIIAVLLNAQNRRQEMKDLLDYTLLSLGEVPPKHD